MVCQKLRPEEVVAVVVVDAKSEQRLAPAPFRFGQHDRIGIGLGIEEGLRVAHNDAERQSTGEDDAAFKLCEEEWQLALDQRAKAWRGLIDTQTSTTAELLEKIAVIRSDAMLDGDAGEGVPVIDAIAADLARIGWEA